MSKSKKQQKLYPNPHGVAAVKNQLNESFQSGVIEDELKNNRGVHHFNNKSR